jgi:hypothetical protein
MADNMDSDIWVGTKRKAEEIEETQTLPLRFDFPSPIPKQDSHSSGDRFTSETRPRFHRQEPFFPRFSLFLSLPLAKAHSLSFVKKYLGFLFLVLIH